MDGDVSRMILTKEEAEKRVVTYTPRDFPMRIGQAAVDFVKFQAAQTNPTFQVDSVVATTTGIAELEKISLAERVEAEALERLKGMQEEAYRQGYDLGRDEGQETAYREKSAELTEKIRRFDHIMASIESLKTDVLKQNEASLVMLIYQIANKLAMTEITAHRELILAVLKMAAQDAQNEESLTIKLSPIDLEFLEEAKGKLGQDFEYMKKAKLEAESEIKPGGCIVATNFGQVDATIEKRLEKVWTALAEKLPKATETFTSTADVGGAATDAAKVAPPEAKDPAAGDDDNGNS